MAPVLWFALVGFRGDDGEREPGAQLSRLRGGLRRASAQTAFTGFHPERLALHD